MESNKYKNYRPQALWNETPSKEPIIIAGPCSAESEKQVIETAIALKQIGINKFRAGVWKPRTYPGQFEGMGVKALPWLVKARDLTNMLIGTEVGLTSHIDAALKHQLDFLWIGARTTSSPFVMQEIANALKGVDLPILIKNPPAPSIDLWIGGVERLIDGGAKRIGLIHRGFDIGHPHHFRNAPLWEMAYKIRNYFPHIPIFLDPSHMAGKIDYLGRLIEIAIMLKYDGIMLESHLTPKEALSDQMQQISPSHLAKVLNNIPILTTSQPSNGALHLLRDEMTSIDERLMILLSQRRQLSKRIGEVKLANGDTPFQSQQYQIKQKQIQELADAFEIPTDIVYQLYNIIHDDSVAIQNNEDL